MSYRTGPLRVGRSLRDAYWASLGAPDGRKQDFILVLMAYDGRREPIFFAYFVGCG
jgi:hypothetical protein